MAGLLWGVCDLGAGSGARCVVRGALDSGGVAAGLGCGVGLWGAAAVVCGEELWCGGPPVE